MINKETKNEKIKILKTFINIGDFWVFNQFITFISDNVKYFKDDVVNALNNILITEDISPNQILQLKRFCTEQQINYSRTCNFRSLHKNLPRSHSQQKRICTL